jgi:hypothetical protein
MEKAEESQLEKLTSKFLGTNVDPATPTKAAKETFKSEIPDVQRELFLDPDLEKRFNFHPANTKEKKEAHERVRGICKDVAYFIKSNVPPGREQSLALTHLEEVMMWANAGIARNNVE